MKNHTTALRAIAFLAVFLAHSPTLHFPAGYLGVQFFFVLSGFLLIPIMSQMKADLNTASFVLNFFGRRTLRIFPLYFTYLLIAYLACTQWNTLAESSDGRAFLNSIAWSGTYTYNFYHASSWFEPSKLVTHLWSLCVEEQFYLVFPILIAMTPERYIKAVLAGCILAAPALRYATQEVVRQRHFDSIGTDADLVIYVSSLSHIDAFAIGGFFALSRITTSKRAMWTAIFLCVSIGYISQRIEMGSIRPIGALGFPAFMAGKPVLGYSLLNALFAYILKHVATGGSDRTVLSAPAPRRFVWKPTATIGGGRSAVWACGQVAERLVHMPMRPCSA